MKLKTNEASFRDLFDASPSASILLVGGNFGKANPRLCTMVGYSGNELLKDLRGRIDSIVSLYGLVFRETRLPRRNEGDRRGRSFGPRFAKEA